MITVASVLLFAACADGGESSGDGTTTTATTSSESGATTAAEEPSTGEPETPEFELTEDGCFPECVADADVTVQGLQLDCEVALRVAGEELVLPECVAGEEGDAALPEAQDDFCVQLRFDAWEQTPQTTDDRGPVCEQQGYNVEITVVERVGVTLPADGQVVASCTLSNNPNVDCPNLP